MKRQLQALVAGCIGHAAIISLIQDIYGKEKYLAVVNAGWLSAWITVPLAIFTLVISLFLWAASNAPECDCAECQRQR